MSAPILTADRLSEAAPYLEQWLTLQTEMRQVPGVQVAVRLGEELLLSAAFGVADEGSGEVLTTSHVFRIASHSKTFTAVAILQLVDARRLRLDDTVGTLLPDHADTDLAGVTVRELLSHTGGVIRDGVDADHWQLERPFPDAAALLTTVREHGRKFAPQEHFAYSNIGYGLLGRIIEVVTGTGYAEHLTAAVLEPLGLTDTSPEPAEDSPRLARGHSRPHGAGRSRVTIDAIGTGALAAATGFAATAEDLAAFFAAQRPGRPDPLLSDHALRLMQRKEATFTRLGAQASYGLGLIHTEIGERAFVGHSGGFPGHITRTLLDPESGLVVCVLTNAIDGPAEALATGLVRLIDLLARDAAAWQQLPDGMTPEDLDHFTGRFHSLWGVVDVVRGGDRLVLLDPEAPNPADSAQELEVVDTHTLRIEAGDGFGGPGEDVPFEFDADGTPVRVRVTGDSHWTEAEFLERRGEAWTRR